MKKEIELVFTILMKNKCSSEYIIANNEKDLIKILDERKDDFLLDSNGEKYYEYFIDIEQTLFNKYFIDGEYDESLRKCDRIENKFLELEMEIFNDIKEKEYNNIEYGRLFDKDTDTSIKHILTNSAYLSRKLYDSLHTQLVLKLNK